MVGISIRNDILDTKKITCLVIGSEEKLKSKPSLEINIGSIS
jgi:hypothetical protein